MQSLLERRLKPACSHARGLRQVRERVVGLGVGLDQVDDALHRARTSWGLRFKQLLEVVVRLQMQDPVDQHLFEVVTVRRRPTEQSVRPVDFLQQKAETAKPARCGRGREVQGEVEADVARDRVSEQGLDHQSPMPDAPPPDELPDFQTRMAPYKDRFGVFLERPRPIDLRYVDWTPPDRSEPLPPFQRVWLRADGVLPDVPVLHACVLTYASDMTLLDTALLPHGGAWGAADLFMASLDHAMWFHRPFRADEWLLYSQDTPSASEGRGLGRGAIFTEDGRLAVTVVQEGLIRVIRS